MKRDPNYWPPFHAKPKSDNPVEDAVVCIMIALIGIGVYTVGMWIFCAFRGIACK